MKIMKNTMKCLVAVFMMVMAFAVTGITAQAAVATFTPQTWSDLKKDPMYVKATYTVPADGSIIIPVKVPSKGGLVYAHVYGDSTFSVWADMYMDYACTKTVDSIYTPGQYDATGGICAFPKGGTYYLKLYTYNDTPVEYAISGYFVNGANQDLTFGKASVVYQNDSSTWVYHKIKAKQTGSLQVTVADSEDNYVYVKLANNRKKDLTEYDMTKLGTIHFGVQKGKVYYIATKANQDAMYGVQAKNVKINEKSGSKQSKAVKVKRNKTVKGVHIANNKTGTDWYKFTLPSKRKFKLTVTGGATDSVSSSYGYSSDLKVEIIPANKRQILYGARTYVVNGYKTGIESKGTLSAGTYYIKVSKESKKSSGWYTLKWQ